MAECSWRLRLARGTSRPRVAPRLAVPLGRQPVPPDVAGHVVLADAQQAGELGPGERRLALRKLRRLAVLAQPGEEPLGRGGVQVVQAGEVAAVEEAAGAGGQLVGAPEPAVEMGVAASRRIAYEPPRQAGA